jgi:hypothetical protein
LNESSHNYWNSAPLKSSCEFGHLKLSKWVYDQMSRTDKKEWRKRSKDIRSGSSELDNISELDETFLAAIQGGHMETIRWLWGAESDNLDIGRRGDLYFKVSCLFGHLNVAKWLMDITIINLFRYQNDALALSYNNGHHNITKWLLELEKPIVDQYLEIENAMIHQ